MIAAFLAVILSADPVQLPANACEVVRVRIHDVDTVNGDILLPFGVVSLVNQAIRANNWDGWEVSRTRQTEPFKSFTSEQWARETEKGIKARDELRKLADGGRFYVVPSVDGKSVYGRLEADFWVVTSQGKVIDVKRWAVENKHVRGKE